MRRFIHWIHPYETGLTIDLCVGNGFRFAVDPFRAAIVLPASAIRSFSHPNSATTGELIQLERQYPSDSPPQKLLLFRRPELGRSGIPARSMR